MFTKSTKSTKSTKFTGPAKSSRCPTCSNSTKSTPRTAADRELAALLRILREPLDLDTPTPTHARVREGPASWRDGEGRMEMVNVGYRRLHKRSLDGVRTDLSQDGRVYPLWEVCGRLVLVAQRLLRRSTIRGRRGARRRGSR